MIRQLFVLAMTFLACCEGLVPSLEAQGTKLWTQSRFEEMERGTTEGIAIRNDGRLEVAPANKLVFTTGGSYVWSVAADLAGNVFVGRGGTTAGSAIVTRVAPDGTATDIFAGKELAVQVLKILSDGTLFAATSPSGKVYLIRPDKSAHVVFDPAETEEKPKYLWDLASRNGDLYVAAGAPAAVYKIPANGGKAKVLFRTNDQHIRCLLLTQSGTLFAGSDGTGVVYRFDTNTAGAVPYALYSAPKREITSLAMDSEGTLFAAGVGAKGNVPLPNLAVTGATSTTITFVQPSSASAVSTSTVIPDGSDVYKIAVDGAPSKLLTFKEDIVYALTMQHGSLMAATGNRGRVYRIDTNVAGRWTDVAHLDAIQGTAFATDKDGLLIATTNNGRVFHLADTASPEATFTSVVFDAQNFSQWGRAEVLPSAAASDLYLRSGNVESPLAGWSEWMKTGPKASKAIVPGARYVQWKVVLHGKETIESVGLNYLGRNIAPIVDEVVVQPGARIAPQQQAANATVQVSFPPASASSPIIVMPTDGGMAPLTAQKDKSAATVRWSAHDDNGDDLMFSIFYRGEGEENWRLLKEKITDRFYSFDSSILPDGIYTVKIVASDSPVHTDLETLSGEKISSFFTIDTTPPVPGLLTATMDGNKIHAHFEARDATSPIGHAEYSVDAGPWQYLEPTGGLSDSLSESYDFLATVPATAPPAANAKEHVLSVRVYDRYENATSAKAVVR